MALVGFTYDQLTLSQVRSRLAARLNDPDNCFWSADELDTYLQESLDTWGLYARYFSNRELGTLTAGEHELDLSLLTNSPLSFSISGQKILRSILLHLIETRSTDLAAYTPTGHISANLLNNYISLAFNQFIQESYSYVNKREYPITSAVLANNSGIFPISSAINNLVRVEHISIEGNIRTLHRTSLQDLRNLSLSGWNSTGRPSYYALDTSSPLHIYLSPWPNDLATLRLYTIEHSPLTVSLLTTDQSWNLPYEFWPAVKYLALYKIYSTDGPTKYDSMADYCLRRYKEYVSLARVYSPINFAWVEEQPMYPSSFADFDHLYTNWRNGTAVNLDSGGKLDKTLGILSPNKVFSRKKYSRNVSLSFDLCVNAPTLTSTSYFPVAEDYLSYILDYAEHLATTKIGGKEFMETLTLYASFISGAMRFNDKIKASLGQLSNESRGAYVQSQSTKEFDRKEATVGGGSERGGRE